MPMGGAIFGGLNYGGNKCGPNGRGGDHFLKIRANKFTPTASGAGPPKAPIMGTKGVGDGVDLTYSEYPRNGAGGRSWSPHGVAEFAKQELFSGWAGRGRLGREPAKNPRGVGRAVGPIIFRGGTPDRPDVGA